MLSLKKKKLLKLLLRIKKTLNIFCLDPKNYYLFFFLIKYYFLGSNLKDIKFFKKLSNFCEYISSAKSIYLYIYNFYKIFNGGFNVFTYDFQILIDDFQPFPLEFRLKHNSSFCVLENHAQGNSNLLIIRNNFFRKKKFSWIYTYFDYKFRIEFISLLVYGRYIEYIRKSVYNEYLAAIDSLIDYPLVKSFLRLIVYLRIKKLKDKKYHLNNRVLLKRYQIFDDYSLNFSEDSSLNWTDDTSILSNNNNNSSTKIILDFVNSKILFLILLWKRKKFLHFLDHLFFRYIKKNALISNYYTNIFYNSDHIPLDYWDYNKLSMMGVFSLYWQMSRYGFDMDYFYYHHGLMKTIINNQFHNINYYNQYYLKFILLKERKISSFFWYKLINLILLEFIYNYAIKSLYLSKFRSNRRKEFYKKLYSWKLYTQTYCFIFLPINYHVYYNDSSLKNHLMTNKKIIDNTFISFFYCYNIIIARKLNFSILNIYSKLNMDNLLSQNFDFYINLCFFYLLKKIGRYFFLNFTIQFTFIRNLILKSLVIVDNNRNFYKDIYRNRYFWYNLFFTKKLIGVNFYKNYKKAFEYEFIYNLEPMMILSFYIIIMHHYYVFFYTIMRIVSDKLDLQTKIFDSRKKIKNKNN